jgi:hypothetical protein
MKLIMIAAGTAVLLSGTAGYAQSRLPGSPAARQATEDPLIKQPTAEQQRHSRVTTGRSIRAPDPVNGRLGGTAASQQETGSSGGQ